MRPIFDGTTGTRNNLYANGGAIDANGAHVAAFGMSP
jgi:hypothetical protein